MKGRGCLVGGLWRRRIIARWRESKGEIHQGGRGDHGGAWSCDPTSFPSWPGRPNAHVPGIHVFVLGTGPGTEKATPLPSLPGEVPAIHVVELRSATKDGRALAGSGARLSVRKSS